MFDVFFIDVNEPNADKNFALLKQKAPYAHRISRVQGIHRAHKKAAEICLTKMLYVVDADAVIEQDFNFDHAPDEYDLQTVHVWHSRNPINDLEYGYGGVKLFPTQLTRQMNTDSVDMSTSISDQFKVMPAVSNITEFNINNFHSWKSGFRECAKLASKVIDRQQDAETEKRLDTWCTVGADKPYGAYAIAGAKAGRQFGELNKNTDQMKLINDYSWLKKKYNEDFSKNN
jgi:hypothetical protein